MLLDHCWEFKCANQ